jgi:hypothetical protein
MQILTIKFVAEEISLANPSRMSHGDVSLQSAIAMKN